MSPILSVVKFTTGRVRKDQPVYIDSVEFVAGEENSQSLLPAWPLDLSADRWLGVGDKDKDRPQFDKQYLVEQAPKFGNGYAKWSVRGFYGEYDEKNKLITRLGAVWGRG